MATLVINLFSILYYCRGLSMPSIFMIQKTNIPQLWLPEATTVILEPTGAIGCRWKAKKTGKMHEFDMTHQAFPSPQTGRRLFSDAKRTKPGTCELPLFWYFNPPKGLAQTSIKTRGTSGVRSWGPVPTVPFHPGTLPVAMIYHGTEQEYPPGKEKTYPTPGEFRQIIDSKSAKQ